MPNCFGGRIQKTLNFTTGAVEYCHVVLVAMLGNGESRSPSNDSELPPHYGVTDQYFSAEDGKDEVSLLPNGIYESIPSIWGHSAGSGRNPADAKWMDEKIAAFMNQN